jgi:glycine/D-amino acid oxidase-like deaminating enzyme
VTIRYLDDPPASAELVIVGGGVIGAAAAFHAARAGLRPLIVETRPRLCTLTTPVAAGAFRLQFDKLEELELVRESAEMFLNFEEVTGQREYALPIMQQGYLWLTTSGEGTASQRTQVAQLHGWGQTDVELLSGEETRARFPWVAPDVVQSRFRAGDGFLDTKRLTFGLVNGSAADVVTSCAATGFATEGGRLTAVRTSRGTIACGAAVICAGPLSGLVAAEAGLELPIVTVKN